MLGFTGAGLYATCSVGSPVLGSELSLTGRVIPQEEGSRVCTATLEHSILSEIVTELSLDARLFEQGIGVIQYL
ncbi:MAG: hypothetical protein AVDCRST_MAG96-3368 [uncultured Segetibacter sp.]|uniref:Uncharacterized protein n=1 Tax=uncultured Segetibacter sp. TaxID=481133 RepID=A0A6J4TNL7_9BACT|nr:MAG: hypothetical protein AVDCRST_MAG96-3368 [uncultured Segetibacter sp.]